MNKFKRNALLLVCILLVAGCTIDGGSVVEADKNKIIRCVDTRDGAVFSFNSSTITNLRIGIGAPGSFDMVTVNGKRMTLNSYMEAWIKCG